MKGRKTMRYTLRPKNKRRPNEQIRPICGKHTKLWHVNHMTLKIIETECTDIWIPARSGHFVYTLSKPFGGGDSCFSRAFGKYIFKTKEEAEARLEYLIKAKAKRIALETQEDKLNKELNLQNHYYIKRRKNK